MDATVRDLERALAAGDEGARASLAVAYLRHGRTEELLELVAQTPRPLPDLLEVEETCWEQELTTLQPAARVPGVRPMARVGGWMGDRWAVIQRDRHHLLGVFDMSTGEPRFETARTDDLILRGVSHQALFCRRGRSDLLTLQEVEPGRWGADPVVLPDDHSLVDVDPAGGLLVVTTFAQPAVTRWLRLDVGTLGPALPQGGWATCWERGLLVTAANGAVHLTGIDPYQPPRSLTVAAVPYRPQVTRILRDGRLLVGPPLHLIDLDTGASTRVLAPAGITHPIRLSHDSRALLTFRMGIPIRIPIEPGAASSPASPPPPKMSHSFWHPRADVVALGLGPDGGELRTATGRPILRLPRDARPLGWTPDGHGLLVARQTSSSNGLLELWVRTPGGTAA